MYRIKVTIIHTEKFIADIVLLYEVSQQLLVFAILVGNLDHMQLKNNAFSAF